MPNIRPRKRSDPMGFASAWLEQNSLFSRIITEAPAQNTGIIVVVPAFDEPGITNLLDSFAGCSLPPCRVEILIVVNAPDNAGEESLINTRNTAAAADSWKKLNQNLFFNVYVIDGLGLKSSGWSVGLARKTGMDEALRRFDLLNNPDGIILNIDADCTVKNDYFEAVYSEMAGRSDRMACSVYFEHPVSGDDFTEEIYRSVKLYELHMRYFVQGLSYAGFPWVHHTVGSAIAIKAIAYVKAGGMNKRSAGEDFYFIQKLLPAGGFFNLTSTTVYPSPRVSTRVPFGTGPVISRLAESPDAGLLSYNPEAFRELRLFFSMIDGFFCEETNTGINKYSDLPPGIRQFISSEDWDTRVTEIRNNTSGMDSFRKRFFSWFNMFRIVKYLNSVHGTHFKKVPVEEAASELLKMMGKDNPAGLTGLLNCFRQLDLNG
ncbi:MAG: glycosyltransferase family 2 protein [Bacteroidales bacterium]|nr:glycosyltransferase family 2 protein [Bacteroidales bacterium]